MHPCWIKALLHLKTILLTPNLWTVVYFYLFSVKSLNIYICFQLIFGGCMCFLFSGEESLFFNREVLFSWSVVNLVYIVYKSSGTPGFQPRPTGISLHLPLRLPNSQAREVKVLAAQQICTMVKFCRLFAPPSSALGFMIIKSECFAEVIDSTVIRCLD